MLLIFIDRFKKIIRYNVNNEREVLRVLVANQVAYVVFDYFIYSFKYF